MPFAEHPTDDTGSSVAAKLSALIALHRHEVDALRSLEEHPVGVGLGETIQKLEEPGAACHIVKTGWFVSESFGPSRGRAISQIHFPGDVIGLSNLPYEHTIFCVTAKSRGAICRVPQESFGKLLSNNSRLAGLLFCMALIEQTQRGDRAALHLRNYATARVALFVLQTLDRLKLNGFHAEDQFHCPLTQMDIGDLVGLTNVHISRTFRQLKQLRMVETHGSFIKVMDRDGLCKLAGYVDRYERLNVNWLPHQ